MINTAVVGSFISNARDYALNAHAEQKYGDKPYAYHLDQVAALAEQYWPPRDAAIKPTVSFGDKHSINYAEIIAAAYLHDTIEDTTVTHKDLQGKFGHDVAKIVYNVSDEPGKNRAERKLNTWHKIRSDPRSIYIKLCDRLANVSVGGKLDMYRKEHAVFKAALYTPGHFEQLWDAIEHKLGI